MAQLSAKHVTNTLQLLADVAAERTAELEDVSENISDTDSDDDYESPCPVYDSFYKQGQSASILQLTGFDACEFQDLWVCIIIPSTNDIIIMSFVLGTWHKGRRKRTQFSGKDAFFMTLVTMKNGGTWEFLARVFSIKAPNFERVVLRFVTLFSETIYDKFVLSGLLTFDMASLQNSGRCFKNYPCDRYATDVTFQQAYRPSGAMEEGKKFYSGKHKIYGYKVEVSVLPIGIAVDGTDHYPGSIADIDIFYNNLEYHKSALSKKIDKGVESVPDHPVQRYHPTSCRTVI